MEKDNRRSEQFKKSKKYKEKHSRVKSKQNEKVHQKNSRQELFKNIITETLKAVNNGYYEYMGNKIKILLTPYTYYGPNSRISYSSGSRTTTRTLFKIMKKTTIQACKDIYFSKLTSPCVLVFASAKNPAGSWFRCSNTQEESISRCSALYNSVYDSPMYAENKNTKNGIYTDAITYCPMVPIFRDEDGNYESEIYYADLVFCPAVNRSICKENSETINKIMYNRIEKILSVMILQGKRHIILGSYGCGGFGNDVDAISGIFKELLNNKFENVFHTVIFAVTDDNHYEIFNNYFSCLENEMKN
jgi:uncharacterized protein (TIGR02452 family)